MELEAKAAKWGNSIGIVIPKSKAQELKLRAGDRVVVEIGKLDSPLKDLFGSVTFRRSTRTLLREVRREMEGKWLRVA